MFGEIIIIIVGFFRWAFKGFKTNLHEEISGNMKSESNIRGQNYMIGILIFLSLIVLTIILSSCNSKEKLLQTDETDNYCLPNSEFNIGGINFNDSILIVRNSFKKPNRTNYDIDFSLETWCFDDLHVEFYNQRVWSVKAFSNKYSTPSGLKVGLSKNDIIKILGYNFNDKKMIISGDKKEIQIVNCKYGNYMVFKFNSNDDLIELEFGNDIP